MCWQRWGEGFTLMQFWRDDKEWDASRYTYRVPHHVKLEVLYPLTPKITYETLFLRVSVSNDNFAKRYNHVQLERQKGITLIVLQTVRWSCEAWGLLLLFFFFSRETNFGKLRRRSRPMFTVSRKLALSAWPELLPLRYFRFCSA